MRGAYQFTNPLASKMTIGIDGGITTPSPPNEAVIAEAYPRSYPRLTMVGIKSMPEERQQEPADVGFDVFEDVRQ